MQKVSKSNSQEEAGTRELIIEAAIRRFAHFGVVKTTLTEIADDLRLSKQAIHHHFPEKQDLVHAVQALMRNEYQDSVRQAIEQADSFLNCLQAVIDVRGQFFHKYHLFMFNTLESEAIYLSSQVRELKLEVQKWEEDLLAARYQQCVEQGELKQGPAAKNIQLIMNTMMAFNYTAKDAWKVRDRDLISQVLEEQKAVIQLLYYGIAS